MQSSAEECRAVIKNGHRGRHFRIAMTTVVALGSLVSATTLAIGFFPHSIAGMALTPYASADPTELDQLIADMDAISRDAGAATEKVKQLEDDVQAKTEEADAAQRTADDAAAHAEEAAAKADALRQEVNSLAQAKYRGAVVDSLSTVLGAENPQSAIDRTAYLTVLTSRSERLMDGLNEALDKAAEEHSAAAAAKAAADFQLAQVQTEQTRLEAERQDLLAKTKEITTRVDQLTAEDRRAWENKNHPVNFELNVAQLMGASETAGNAVVSALSRVGSPYSWGATGPDSFDCSGLMVWAYAQQGITIPRTSQAQMAGGTPVSRDELLPGDIIGYWPGATHVAMYVGDGMVVHASDYGIPVQVVPIDSMPFYGARRY